MPRRDDLARVESWQWGMQSASARTPSARPASFRYSGAPASWPTSTPRSRRRRPGHGGLVLLTGEPGIGKTRLATALGERAAADGHRVAWARGWDGGGAPAFWPWVQIVRALAADRDDDAPAHRARRRRALGGPARARAARAPGPARGRRPRVRAGALRALRRRHRLPAQRRGARAARRAPRRPPHRRPAVAAAARLPRPGAERDARAGDHHPPRGGAAARARGRGRVRRAHALRACASTSAGSRTTTCARWSSTAAAPTRSEELVHTPARR